MSKRNNLEERVNKMIKKMVILPDVHINTTVPKPYQVVKNFIKLYKPDEIVLLGDYMDVQSLSAWDMDKRKLMEGRRYKKEVEVTNKELDFLQKHSKNITYIEGNHENRVERYIEKNPEMEGLLEIKDCLNLDERGIKYVEMNKLYKVGHCYLTHGLYTNKYHASKHLTSLGCNIIYGHTHRPDISSMIMKMQKPIMAWGLGCLCDKEPDYLRGRPSNWVDQFAIMEFETKTGEFTVLPINIVNNKFIYNKKKYGL